MQGNTWMSAASICRTRSIEHVAFLIRFVQRFARRTIWKDSIVGADDEDEQNNPASRRGRFIAAIADLSALAGFSTLQVNKHYRAQRRCMA